MLIDYQYGLSQLGGNETLLKKLFTRLIDEYKDADQRLRDFIDNDNLSDAKTLSHTLKGVSGNLGCTQLFEHTKLLDEELKHGLQSPASVEKFSEILQATMAELKRFTEEGSAASAHSENVKKLILAMQNNEFISPDFLGACLANINLPDMQIDALETAVNSLDYSKALEILGH